MAWLIGLLRDSKTSSAVSFKLLRENRISGPSLSIEAEPNHFRLQLREADSAARLLRTCVASGTFGTSQKTIAIPPRIFAHEFPWATGNASAPCR